MADHWTRNPDQQALVEAEAIVDARPRPDIIVRRYPGAPGQAVADFKADVAQMIPAGWQPINVVYISTPYDAANVLAVGPLALAQSPQGALQAIYRYQPPGS